MPDADPGSVRPQPDDLVVDLADLEGVRPLLAQLAVDFVETSNDHLGLARLSELMLAGDDPANPRHPIDADGLASILRRRAAAARDGWLPQIAVNRTADAIIGDGVVGLKSHKPMDFGDPAVPGPSVMVPPAPTGSLGAGVTVGVVDTKPAAAGASPVGFRSGHGTFVRSLIRRQAPGATIRLEGVIDATPGRARSWEVAEAIARLTTGDDAVDVLNLSLGTYSTVGGPPLAIARAVERVADGVLVVAAAGNHGDLPGLVDGRTKDSACWPAAMHQVVAVGAVDGDGVRPPWSPNAGWIACTAPGVAIVADYLQGVVTMSDGSIVEFTGHAVWSGTSFAAATVSGALAAAMSGPGRRTPRQALDALLESSDLVRPFAVTP
ncbi:S8 family peptidase [Microlunatus ginsengisoli]|uniref:Peptidase S8/S53 domain-containing protein n=1 Tax=Microlunatus ginsengisoli TaxID=363863 RepID=A0ABP6ZLZ0_9ACTN